MEEWQRKHIWQNMPELASLIRCHTLLIAMLENKHLLSKFDAEELKAEQTERAKSVKLLDILLTRSNGYEILMEALKETVQTGAYVILEKGYQQNKGEKLSLTSDVTFSLPEILSKEVLFLGQKHTLQELCKDIPPSELKDMVKDSYHGGDLESATISLADNTIPHALPYYIERSLSLQNRIDPAAFELLQDDIFLIQHIELKKLKKLAWNATPWIPTDETSGHDSVTETTETDVSSNQIRKVTCRFILLEAEEHFYQIVKVTQCPVHWINFKDGNYMLITSSRNPDNIEKFILPKENIVTEKDFIRSMSHTDSPSIIGISACSGMGKSVLLVQIAEKLQSAYPERIVLFFKLSKLIIKCHDQRKYDLDKQLIQDIIISLVSKNDLGKAILRKLLSSPDHQKELLFDGFDEVPPEMMETAETVLKTIMEKFVQTRIYVTTRPHMRQNLQTYLCSYAYTICPLSWWEQHIFAEIYLEYNRTPKLDTKNLQELQLSFWEVERNGQNVETTGVPLVCKIIAEIRIEDMVLGKKHYRKHPFYKIYRRHINKCFGKVFETDWNNVMDFHQFQAMKLVFPEIVPTKTVKIANADINYSIGLLEDDSIELHPRFIHQPFAEYLVADVLVLCIKNKEHIHTVPWIVRKDVLSLLLNTVLLSIHNTGLRQSSKFVNLGVVYFFDRHLKFHGMWTVDDALVEVFLESKMLESETLSEKLCAALFHDYFSIFKFLRILVLRLKGAQSPWIKDLDWNKMLQISAEFSRAKLFVACCELSENVKETCLHDVIFVGITRNPNMDTLLHIIIRRGEYEIFKYLINAYEEKLPELRRLLHTCLVDSYKNPWNTSHNKVQIIRYLASVHKECLEERDSNFRSPWLANNVHYRLIKCLVELGVDISTTDKKNRNAAHIRALHLDPSEYHQFVLLIVEKTGATLFTSKDKYSRTPVHYLMSKMEVEIDTLQILCDKAKVTFNNEDVDGITEFFQAISGGRGREILEFMIKFGVDWKRKNKSDQNALEIACQAGNQDAVRLLLSMDSDGNLMKNNFAKYVKGDVDDLLDNFKKVKF